MTQLTPTKEKEIWMIINGTWFTQHFFDQKNWKKMKWVKMWNTPIEDLIHKLLGPILVFIHFSSKYSSFKLELFIKNGLSNFKLQLCIHSLRIKTSIEQLMLT